MTIATAVMAVGAALLFALYTVILEWGMRGAREDADVSPALMAAFLSTAVAFVGFWALALLRGLPSAALDPARIAPFLVAGVAYPALFRLTYYEAIDRIGASAAAAIEAAHPVVSVALAIAFLGESVTPLGGMGVALIVAGAVLIQLARGSGAGDAITGKLASADAVDLLYSVAALVLVGGAFVLIKYGLDRFPDPVAATAITQTPAVAFLAVTVVVRGRTGPAGSLRLRPAVAGTYALSGGLIVLAWLLQFFALRAGTVVTVVPLLNTYALWVVAISYAAARQVPRSPRVLAAVLAIVAGATLLQVT